MVSYISKLLTLTIFSGYSIFLYYSIFTHHIETIPGNLIIYNKIPVGLLYYLIPLVIIYGLYKLLSYYVFNDPENETIEIKYTSMIFYGLLNLFLLCIVFFSTKSGFSGSQGISLFFKILGFLILPLIIFLSSFGFGNKILGYVKGYEQEDNSFKFLSSIGLGFYFFLAIFYILAFLGLYNSTSFLIIIILFLIIGYKNLFFLLKNLFLTKIKIDKDINLYTSEFLFIIISALISTNLILVFRPFPIGWDDLGVYMNFPHLLATAGELLPLGGMQTWEIYTGIGYLFGSATQAFYLNSFSGILASIFIYLIAKSFFTEKNEFINIPLIIVAIFISMPMVIFQIGKDMKLDIGLFTISIIPLYLVYYIYIKGIFENKINKICNLNFIDSKLIYIFLIGILLGFSFAIKPTSLMLISAVIGLIIYLKIGLSAFLGYLAIYLSIFTKFQLWDMLNVVYPKNNLVFINWFSSISFIIGSFLFYYSFIKNKKEILLKLLRLY